MAYNRGKRSWMGKALTRPRPVPKRLKGSPSRVGKAAAEFTRSRPSKAGRVRRG